MKDSLKITAVCACVFTLGVLTARCALSEPVAAVEVTRITAPCASLYVDEHVRVDYIPQAVEREPDATEYPERIDTAVISPVEVYTPAYVLMDGVPLDASVQLAIEQMCADRDVDVAVVLAMIERESGYDAAAVGDGGTSFGLMQVRPDCHYDRMERLGVTDLHDGVGNVTVGIDYLDECLDRCGGDYAAALTMYNRGSFDGEVNAYARAVLGAVMAKELK